MADAEFADRAVFLPTADALVLSDLHIGRDATSNVSLSLGERADLTTRVSGPPRPLFAARIVLAGDVLHAFDGFRKEAEETFADLRELADEAGAALVVVRGNHDTRIDELAEAQRRTIASRTTRWSVTATRNPNGMPHGTSSATTTPPSKSRENDARVTSGGTKPTGGRTFSSSRRSPASRAEW